MPTTPKYGLPYPALSDAPNGPLGIQNLANGVDALGVLGGKYRTTTSANIVSIESVVVDTQTLSLPANSVFRIEFYLCFTNSVAGTDCDMKIRQTSVSGTILGETVALGVYTSPEPNHGYLSVIYQTTATELDYFAGTVIRQGTGTGNINAIVPTSIIVTNLGPSAIIGQY